MRVSQSIRFAFATPMPIAKVGFPLPTPFISNANVFDSSNRDTAQNVQSSVRRFSVEDLRHNFAIKALQKPGLFKPRPYLYICVRCRYTFLVNRRRGSIEALDRERRLIPEPENSARLATFAEGPCTAFKTASRRMQRQTVELPKRRRVSPSGLLRLVALIGARARYPYFAESHVDAPAGIVPQDMLF
jgi:hypothetical protein